MYLRTCINHSDQLCYMCGRVTTKFILECSWRPRQTNSTTYSCKCSTWNLHCWNNKNLTSLNFGIPMIWREGKNQVWIAIFV